MEQRIGSCSLCGGDVMAVYPSTPRCFQCWATATVDVIQMDPARPRPVYWPLQNKTRTVVIPPMNKIDVTV